MAFLVDDIFLAPLKGIKALANQVAKLGSRELDSESKLQSELLEAQMLFESDEITEEEYQKREDAIMKRLNAIIEAKREKSK